MILRKMFTLFDILKSKKIFINKIVIVIKDKPEVWGKKNKKQSNLL